MGKKVKIDGKEIDLSEFDDTKFWSRPRKEKRKIKSETVSSIPNILGRV